MTESNVLTLDLSAKRAQQLLAELSNDSSKVVFTVHAKHRMKERGITDIQVLRCLRNGHFIEGPARGVKGNWEMTIEVLSAGTPVRVVAALDYNQVTGNYVIIVTAYCC